VDSTEKIWVLGAKSNYAHDDFEWYDGFPNFSDPDILIINLTSLTKEVLESIQRTRSAEYINARNSIKDKFISGGTLIFIIAHRFSLSENYDVPHLSNWYFSPFSIGTANVKDGRVVRPSQDYEFQEYISHVKTFNYNLIGIQQVIREIKSITTPSRYKVRDNSDNYLGIGFETRDLKEPSSRNGKVIYLPPPTDITVEGAIDLLLQKFGRGTGREPPPKWVFQIPLTGLDEIKQELENLETAKKTLEQKINLKKQDQHRLTDHYRLLYSKGCELEQAVLEAFKTLGFNEVGRKREKNREDGVFEFKHSSEYKFASLEAKGADKRTAQHDLTQCNKWSDELADELNKSIKAVFIPNQNRKNPYPESKSDREYFHPEELRYAKRKDICIIPSHVLFEAVTRALAKQGKSREKLERIISESKGLLTEL
jgi:hypothetical protein